MRPSELPRLFAQDTLLASKATLIEDPVSIALRADLRALGVPELKAGPTLKGYNLTYLRPGALVGLQTVDENKAPVLAWRQAGAGRTAAYTGQVGGDWGQDALKWPGFIPTFSALGRWLVATEPPEGWFATATREGQEAVLRVERDPERGGAGGAPTARLRGPDGRVQEVELRRGRGDPPASARDGLAGGADPSRGHRDRWAHPAPRGLGLGRHGERAPGPALRRAGERGGGSGAELGAGGDRRWPAGAGDRRAQASPAATPPDVGDALSQARRAADRNLKRR